MRRKAKIPKHFPKPRNPVARSLADARFQPRVVPQKPAAMRRREDAARDAARMDD